MAESIAAHFENGFSHGLIERIADRIGILKAGRLAVEGELGSIKALWPFPLEKIFTAVVGKDDGAGA